MTAIDADNRPTLEEFLQYVDDLEVAENSVSELVSCVLGEPQVRTE